MRSAVLLLVLAGLVRSGSAHCANDCNGNGRCNAHSACECYRNWMGNDCSQRVCFFGRAFVDTPAGDLNSDGKVSANQNVMAMSGNTPSHELFDQAYALGDVSTGEFNEAHFYAECSGKGSCERESGLCECFTGYEGEGCTRVSCASATGETCSGHGVCLRLADSDSSEGTYQSWDSHKTQQCDCDPLYTGISCDQRACPSGDDPVTKFEHVTMLCGIWGLDSEVSSTGKDPSTLVNEYAKGTDVYGTVSGASAKLAFFCGVKSSDVLPRQLSTSTQTEKEGVCRTHQRESDCTADSVNTCAWQAAVTRVTPSHGQETCITVQGVTGLFTPTDSVVTGNMNYLLNSTSRIQHNYRENLKQSNEVQSLTIQGAVCDQGACEMTAGVCAPAAGTVFGEDPAYKNLAIKTCGMVSHGTTFPRLASQTNTNLDGICAEVNIHLGTSCTSRNPFALTFEDEYGSHFTTRSIECISYSDIYPLTLNPTDPLLVERHAAGEHCRGLVESALEDLPNSALIDIDVTDSMRGSHNDPSHPTVNSIISYTASVAIDGTCRGATVNGVCDHEAQQGSDHFLNIKFISNTGDVAPMAVIGQDTEAGAGTEVIHHSEQYVKPAVTVKEVFKGTSENQVCSNRGTCDYSTGICKCFQGFTRADCSLQNVLAMY